MTGSAKRGGPAGGVAIFDPRKAFPGCATEEPFVGKVTDQNGTVIGGVVVMLACSRTLAVADVAALFAAQAKLLRTLADGLEEYESLPTPPNAPGGAS